MAFYNAFKIEEDMPLQAKMLAKQIENAQRMIEGKNFGIRRQIIEYDDVMNTQRQVIYNESCLELDDIIESIENVGYMVI